MSVLSRWVQEAKVGSPVWINDVREASLASPDCQKVIFRLTLCDGTQKDYCHAFPLWETAEERRFVQEYFCACVFNTLAALGGQELRFFYDRSCEAIADLIQDVRMLFSPLSMSGHGYSKAVRVANRLCAAAGTAPFHFAEADLDFWSPLPGQVDTAAGDLGQLLRRTAEKADVAVCCGIDVGGTDIKLAIADHGRLAAVRELDWNPAVCSTADGLIQPILRMVRTAMVDSGVAAFDAIGLSFPDIVIGNRILGGETPKTKGMRENPALDYEAEFRKLGDLRKALLNLCRPDGRVELTNDGNMAAFCAAVELAHGPEADAIGKGVLAHSLGTDLGTGWLRADGAIPPLPLEMYDFLLDLGSWPQRDLPPEDLRSVRNENSGLPGARRYLGQAAAFRLAYEGAPKLLEGFYERSPSGNLLIKTAPQDLRKPCLEHLMMLAQEGCTDAEEVFRQIGRHLAQVNREMRFLLSPETDSRFLFGRFVRHPRCFALLQEGCREITPSLRLLAADGELARSALMRQLAQMGDGAVARCGQAVGAIYFGQYGEDAP